MSDQPVVFHYTVRKQLEEYLQSGGIASGWFSTSPQWDACAQGIDDTGELISKDETREWGQGLIRITVPEDLAPYTWPEWKVSGQVAQAQAKNFDLAAAAGSRREDWRFTKKGVPVDEWLAVEIDVGTGWVPFEGFPPSAAEAKGGPA
jgi:hypothetical protein